MVTVKKAYKKNLGMVSRKIANELILVPVRQNVAQMECIYTLNPTAGRIWEILDSRDTIDEIVSLMKQEYSAPENELETDVIELLKQLEEIEAIKEKTGE